MNYTIISQDIINAIDRLQNNEQNKDSEQEQDIRKSLVGLITPEWYHSDSFKILDSANINWDNLEDFELIQNMAKSLSNKKINIESMPEEVFEKTFCGWYQPYHHLPRIKWGVHMRYDSWIRIAAKLNTDCPFLIKKPLHSIKAAFLYLFIHLLFHYIIENASSMMEIISGNQHMYKKYYRNVYARVFNSPDCIEESLANRYLFGQSQHCHIDKQYLNKELLKQGDGYREFINYLSSNFSKGIRQLMLQIKNGQMNPPYDEPLEQIVCGSNLVDYSSVDRISIWLHYKAKPLH
jgi:hypothetical protein